MSFVKKQNIDKTSNASKNISRKLPSLDIQNKIEENIKNVQSTKLSKEKDMLKKQLKLIENKQVRAVPGGYYTGLINDMHKDYKNFQEKGTFLQMEYLNPLKQTSHFIDYYNDEKKFEKFQAPITLNSLSIQCTLPSNYNQLENLSSLEFLIKYTKPSINRQEIILKLIRKIQRDAIIDIDDTKDIIFEYFNHYKTYEDINELFHFLDINFLNRFQLNEIVMICCYAERYFLYKLAQNENIVFKRPLQEIIDFEFLKRKFDGLKLNDSLQRLIKTLEGSVRYEL